MTSKFVNVIHIKLQVFSKINNFQYPFKKSDINKV